MRTKLFAGAVAALALAAGTAQAADLYKNSSQPAESPGFPIAGFYGEVSVGPAFTSNGLNLLDSSVSLSSEGGVVNARVGYDYKFPTSRFGVGLWGEGGSGFSLSGSASALGKGFKWSEDWTWGAGGKLFYDHGQGQIYVIGGYAGAEEAITPPAGGGSKATKTLTGGEWGTGISLKLVGNVYGKLEFDQIIYTDANLGTNAKWEQVDNRFLLGLGVSLGGTISPIK